MRRFKVGRRCAWFVVPVGLLALVMVFVAWSGAVYAQGVTITIKAQNKSDQDTPFCGTGGGLVGDKLAVSVATDLSGTTTGTATLTRGTAILTSEILSPITLHIDAVEGFFGGILLRETSTNNVIPIWLDDGNAPFHVNVELPQGCGNTVSTFTSGVDKVSVQIKGK
jgi:hypothetical protein